MSAAAPRAPWLVRLTLALALTALAPDVAAQEAKLRAKQLFDRAEVHFSLHEFRKALPLYAAAYRVKPMPEFLFNMGQCHRYLGHHEQAIFHYKQFMLKKPSSLQRPQVEQLVAEAESNLRAEQAASAVAEAGSPSTAQACLSRGWFWGAVGLTAALTVTSITTGVVASGQEGDTRGLEITAWTTLGGAVVAAASTVGLFVLSRPSPSPRKGGAQLQLVPLVAQQSGGVLLYGRF